MSTERVTVSLPASTLRAAQRVAEQRGVPFSTVVSEALGGWLRGQRPRRPHPVGGRPRHADDRRALLILRGQGLR